MVCRIIKITVFLAAVLAFLFLAVILAAVYGFHENPPAAEPLFGVTFSRKQAEYFRLEWKKTYLAVLDDLKVRSIRLPAYWDEIEPKEGEFIFGELDWQVREAENRGTKIILTVGLRLPRWPECHAPGWAREFFPQGGKNRGGDLVLKYIEATVRHYRGYGNITAWQIENEPFLSGFGECPDSDAGLLNREITLVKSLDKRPVVITDSGELGDWFRAYRRSDIFGTTMYRKVWSSRFGFYKYPLPPVFFWFREGLVDLFSGKKVVVGAELQAEPWGSPHQLYEMTPSATADALSLREMLEFIDYSRRVGLPENYLWGVEWWAWMKDKGYPEYWNLAKLTLSE